MDTVDVVDFGDGKYVEGTVAAVLEEESLDAAIAEELSVSFGLALLDAAEPRGEQSIESW